jgi:hypothetical protein
MTLFGPPYFAGHFDQLDARCLVRCDAPTLERRKLARELLAMLRHADQAMRADALRSGEMPA